MNRRWLILFLPASVIACSKEEDAKQLQIGSPEVVVAGQERSETKPTASIEVIRPPLNGPAIKPGEKLECEIMVRAAEGERLPEAITVYIYDKNRIMGSVAAEIVKRDGTRSVEMRAALNVPREPKQYELKVEGIYTTRRYSEPRLIRIVGGGK